MLLLACPNCGNRNVSEFRFGGEVNARPKDPSATEENAWTDYLYMRRNVSGEETEWWYHRDGCGLWFLADRDTYTNHVRRTYVWRPAGAVPEAAETGDQPAGTSGDAAQP